MSDKDITDSLKLLRSHSDAFFEAFYLLKDVQYIFGEVDRWKEELLEFGNDLEELGYDELEVKISEFIQLFQKDLETEI